MKKPFIKIDAEKFTLSAFETKPIEGYEEPTNKDTGEQLPYCCTYHKSVFEVAKSWFEKFPNCCNPHRAMVTKWWFNKNNYTGVPEKIVNQLSFTEYHITKQIENPDWYEDITEYINYNISSFGHPAIGLHLYLENLKHYIKSTSSEIPKEKRQRLLEYIDEYYNPSKTKDGKNSDLNILYSTYQRWLKTFPFEISYFKNLKQHFEKQLPILGDKPEMNRYTGIVKTKVQTQSELIEALTNTTKQLLQKIDTADLLSKGIISDNNKHTLELANENHRIKQSSLVCEYSKGEIKYVKILKRWLTNEKQYFNEITTLLDKTLQQFEQPQVEKPFTPVDISNPNNKNQMQYFHEFINEVQTLDIKVKEFYIGNGGYFKDITPERNPGLPYQKSKYLDLSHYDQHDSDYESQLVRLQQLAINEILLCSPDQLKQQLRRLELIKRRFSKFWKVYSNLNKSFQEKNLQKIDIEIEVFPLFIIPEKSSIDVVVNINQDFLYNLMDAVMFKQGCLKSFETQVKEVLGIEENEDGAFNEKPDLTTRLPIPIKKDQVEKQLSEHESSKEVKGKITDTNKPSQQAETKTERLKAELGKYGFFELAAVKPLSEPKKQKLIELISSNNLPYCIAMFDYLGYIKHLEKEYFNLKYKLHKEVSRWFNSDKEGRAVKGNISSLLKNTTENKGRYTAYKHKETVQKDYQKLK